MMTKTVNLAFAGDCHGSILSLYEYLLELESRDNIAIDAVVHVGDFGMYLHGPKSPVEPTFQALWDGGYVIPIPTWVCPGNHEDYTVIKQILADPSRIKNFHILPDGEVTNVMGVKIGVVWGNYSYKSYAMPDVIEGARRLKQHSRKAMHIYRPSVEKLLQAGPFDVLVTHDAPAGYEPKKFIMYDSLRLQMGLDPDEQLPGGCPAFLDIHRICQPLAHYFGHFHCRRVMKRNEPRITCLHAVDRRVTEAVEVNQYEV